MSGGFFVMGRIEEGWMFVGVIGLKRKKRG